MKKATFFFSFLIVAAVVLLLVPNVQAYQFYSDDIGTSGGCAQCHGAFRSGKYVSPADGADWGVHLHAGHLNETTIGSSCDNCHYGAGTTGRQVNLRSSAAAADGVNAVSCSGCHGRLEDANGVNQNGTGWGAGLRQHHFYSGVTDCLNCHADTDPVAFTPAGEEVMPVWYGSVTNNITGTTLNPCNTNGAEHFAGSAQGNDNDGDLAYDAADSNCQAGGVCGDGVVDEGETCDEGEANGSTICGCQSYCDYKPQGMGCSDGLYCNGWEQCDGAGSCTAEPVDCNDGVNCTDDSCDEANDTCINAANDANCPDDGQFCTGVEYCDTVTDCDSIIPCTEPGETCNEAIDSCDQLCGNGTLDAGEVCDDGVANGTSDCGCQADCNYASAGTSCADGEYCNGDEICDGAGSCQAGTPVTCDDGVGCTDDTCDEVNDTCVNAANDANCNDDGQFCTGTEFCDAVNDCSSSGDPCGAGETCNDVTDTCDTATCADIPDKGTCENDPNCEWVGSPKNGTCQDAVVCVPDETPEASCTDGVDNDCDGLTDCADSADCGADPVCQGGSCDSYADKGTCQNDLNCEWVGSPKSGTCQDAVVCVPDETPEASCTDGVDNDCDGMTDCADTDDCGADPACQGGSCDTYTDKVSCQNNGCTWSNKDKVCM